MSVIIRLSWCIKTPSHCKWETKRGVARDLSKGYKRRLLLVFLRLYAGKCVKPTKKCDTK